MDDAEEQSTGAQTQKERRQTTDKARGDSESVRVPPLQRRRSAIQKICRRCILIACSCQSFHSMDPRMKRIRQEAKEAAERCHDGGVIGIIRDVEDYGFKCERVCDTG